MKNIVIGMLAHVDAGKTTLSEGMLYTGNAIRKLGRVDNRDTFLDTDKQERDRGITIFSKQAVLKTKNTCITLLDTPGHVDFSAEMERTLSVLDYAVLVISGADGVQAHTRTVWKLLEQYGIPVFIFVNKMDQPAADKQSLLDELGKQLSGNCVEFYDGSEESEGATGKIPEDFEENLAMCEEKCMEDYLENGSIRQEHIEAAIRHRHVFPCIFGSALKLQGVDMLLNMIDRYTVMPEAPKEFGARVYKINRDAQGNRLTFLKVTGGTLAVKQFIGDEKVNELRVYSGTRYESVQEVYPGMVCAVTGLNQSSPGQGVGAENGSVCTLLEPVLSYRICLPEDVSPSGLLPELKQLEEEEPKLHISWNEELQEIHVKLMGEVQTEILRNIISDRYGVHVGFDEGNVVYMETVADKVEGIGHFEPLRHYAEVHVIIEPGARGSGVEIASDCREDVLDRNWQRLVMTHLSEREHAGVLTGSALTDVKLTLITGRAHIKHTEGGDFRQATYRAVRQGLMKARSVLLEPFYNFTLDIPASLIGRAMTDIERMSGTCMPPDIRGDRAVLSGRAPVVTMRNYQKEVNAYSKGEGNLTLTASGYDVCHNTEEVVKAIGYVPEEDQANPSASVFCAHGAGFVVPWNEVENYMHMEAMLKDDGSIRNADDEQDSLLQGAFGANRSMGGLSDEEYTEKYYAMGTEEVDAIIARTAFSNSHDKDTVKRWAVKRSTEETPAIRDYNRPKPKEAYLLVDGYNIIFAWEELKEIAAVNVDGARGRLLDIMCNYQGIRKMNLIVVFDAYRVKGHDTEYLDYNNIHVVYTKEAETADRYIERFAHENGRKYDVMVATSDGLEQIIIRGQGCRLMSARDFEKEVASAVSGMNENYNSTHRVEKNYLGEHDLFKDNQLDFRED